MFPLQESQESLNNELRNLEFSDLDLEIEQELDAKQTFFLSLRAGAKNTRGPIKDGLRVMEGGKDDIEERAEKFLEDLKTHYGELRTEPANSEKIEAFVEKVQWLLDEIRQPENSNEFGKILTKVYRKVIKLNIKVAEVYALFGEIFEDGTEALECYQKAHDVCVAYPEEQHDESDSWFFALKIADLETGEKKQIQKYLKIFEQGHNMYDIWDIFQMKFDNIYHTGIRVAETHTEEWFEEQRISIEGSNEPDKTNTLTRLNSIQKAMEINRSRLLDIYGGVTEKTFYKFMLKASKKAVKYNPNNDEAFYYLGLCFEKMEQYEEAVEAYQRSFELSNEKMIKNIVNGEIIVGGRAVESLCSCLKELGRHEEVDEVLKKYNEISEMAKKIVRIP